MKLEELTYVLEQLYDFKLWDKGRKGDVVCARKVFCKLASDMGYGPTAMGRATGQPHDLMIYHKSTFHSVMPIDIHHYNACIDYFNLPLNKISNIRELLYGNEINKAIEQLRDLNSKELKDLINFVIPNYKKKLKWEKSIKEMGAQY